MAQYPEARLTQLLTTPPGRDDLSRVYTQVVDDLVDAWLDEYGGLYDTSDVVAPRDNGFEYLFDINAQRLIAAWGLSSGRASHTRDTSRQAGHPMSLGSLYHRGHAIAHTLGGGMDINIVPQLARVNIGDFRRLERQAVATPGSLYFSYWIYPDAETQTPSGVEQGLLEAGRPPTITRLGN